jgi:amino acid adenylation domain-containing protein
MPLMPPLRESTIPTLEAPSRRPFPARARGVHELIARRAARDPQAIAVVADGGGGAGERLTYGDLVGRAGRLARRLRALGVGPEVPVGLFVERSGAAVAGLLGILESGGAYLPLDPALPVERLAFLIADSRLAVVVTRGALAGALPPHGAKIVDLDRLADEGPEPPPRQPAPMLPDGLAYVIYTSGSTGRPKGVAVSHRAIARHALAMARRWRLTPADRVLQFYGLSFDLSIEQILPPLVAGARVVLRGEAGWSAGEFALRVRELGLTMASLPPAYFGEVAREGAGRRRAKGGKEDRLRLVTTGGERMEPDRLALWRQGPWGELPLVNAYGPTEATITATAFALPAGFAPEGSRVPIGRPLPGRAAHLLDRDGRPVAAGAPGELCLGGRGLARGYLGDAALTAERFVPDPFAALPGARLYRTGDLAARLPSGDLDFAGRIDEQVKIRGFRVEPGEIEAALRAHARVGDAAVVAREDRPGERRLVAYFVGDVGGAELRRHLAGNLPAYMVPAAFVALERLPRTPGGKLDRRALPAPERRRPEIAAPYSPPRRALEERLAALWAELFAVDRVGVDDPFVELGGHSLLAIQLASRVRDALGLDLPLHNPFAVPTVAELAKLIEGSGAGKPAAPELAIVRVPRGARGGDLPLASSQERAWFLHRMDPASRAYQTQFTVRFRGALDLPALAGALAEIVRRHEIFRTTFPAVAGEPVERIHPAGPSALPIVDLSALPEERREAAARRLVTDGLQAPFDLERLPLIRWTLLRMAAADHLLAVVEHHIVHDGWSNNLLLRELVELYRAASAGLPSPLPEPEIQFADYAVWQRRWLESAEAARQLDFWRRGLAGCAPLEIPGDRPRPAAPSYRGEAPRFDLPAPLGGALRALARERGATLFAAMLAAFAALLHRWTGETDLCVGSGIANRRRRETEGLIGMIVNNVVLRNDLSGDIGGPTFAALLARSMAVAVEAYAHQDLPFDRVVEAVRPQRERGLNPLFQAMLSFHDSAMPELDLPGVEAAVEGLMSNGSAKFDLNVVMIPRADQARSWRVGRPERITVSWEYSSDLFDPPTITRMTGHFTRLLEAVAADPEMRIGDLPLLSAGEAHQLVVEAREMATFPGGECLDELFLRQAAATPDAVAVTCEGESWTYAELRRRAGEVAARLGALGVRAETPVALCLERSPDQVAAILGVLAAGGAYVPLDPSLPAERLAWLLEDAAAPVVVTTSALLARLPEPRPAAVCLDLPLQGAASLPQRFPTSERDARTAAYVIYTSGSTGLPKGVVVTHDDVRRLFAAARERFDFAADDVWTLFHSYAFDFSVWEIWGALLHGGRLVIVPRTASRSPEELLRLLRAERVTVLNQTPSAFRHLVRARELAAAAEDSEGGAPLALRWVIFGGEALDPRTLQPWIDRHGDERPALVNMYGITETTIHVTWRRIERRDAAGARSFASPVGRPLADLEVLLLDRRGEPVPLGVPGEIHVGGPGLARGYLGRPALTAERFVPHPWGGTTASGARLYRSGDLARRRPAGDLEVLGRTDQQVKVRGFRIEPAEIEAALAAHPGVAMSAVVARPDATGEHRLAAYVVGVADAAEAPLAAGLRAFLKERLPEHMIPSAFVPLASLPLNANGKLDRAALPAPGGERPETVSLETPQSPLEARLAAIWAELLEVDRVGVNDDFFTLGGYSLLAVRLLHRVREELGVELPLGRLFDDPTVAGLAAALDRLAPPADAEPSEPSLPLSFAQRRLWFLDQLQPGSPVYNVARAVRVEGELAPPVLAAALAEIVRRHQVLRAVFAGGVDGADGADGEPVQKLSPAGPRELPQADLTALPAAARRGEARRLASAEAARPFDLARGPLLRATLVRLGAAESVLLLTLHHAVADAWSMALLFRELGALAAAGAAGRPSPLPPLGAQYADFTRWQRERLQGERLAAEVAWWRDRLAGVPDLLALPADRPRPAVQSTRGGSVGLALPAPLAARLRALARTSRASLFMLLLAAFQALLARLTGATDLVVGTPVANRERAEWAGLVGFFLNTLALRADLGGDPPFGELLGRVREGALAAYGHAEVPFEHLVEELRPERRPSHAPLFQVMFAVDGEPPRPLAFPGFALHPEAVASGTAKFDLTLVVEDAGGALGGYCEYARDLFSAATVQRLLAAWGTLLAAVAEAGIEETAGPSRRLSELPLLAAAERHQLVAEWGHGAAPAVARDVVSRWEASVARSPAATAVIGFPTGPEAGERLTYGELHRRVARLARRLRALGVGTETRVALAVGRGAEMPVAVLAVLAAGGAYVPIDPSLPAERIALMLADSRSALLLTRRGLLAGLPATAARRMDFDDLETAEGRDEAPAAPFPSRPAESLAYITYTSGSTGRPKGVAMAHAALANLIAWQLGGAPAPRTTLQFASLSFDVSVQELFTTWGSGGALVLIPEELRRDPGALLDRLAATGVERAFLPPAALEQLAEAAAERADLAGVRLREVITAGEQLRVTPPVAALFARLPGAVLINHYGPSETHAATALELRGDPRGWPPLPAIGTPVDNAWSLVLDAGLEPVPAGVAGELWVGGRGLARGYFDRPDATAERFRPDPFAAARGIHGERLYRTGDRARVRAGGCYEFLGRVDGQVKLRGYRIEPGEIEAALGTHPAVAEAVVVLRQDDVDAEAGADGPERASMRLVAYVVARGANGVGGTDGALAPELRAHLATRLPDYMVPSAFVRLAALPLNASGKIDRRALPAPEGAVAETPALPPRNAVEREVAAIWCEVLKLPAAGVEDDFFAAGGHSLLATRVISRLRRAFGVDLPLHELFAGPTIAELALAVERLRGAGTTAETMETMPRTAGIIAVSRRERRLPPLPEGSG